MSSTLCHLFGFFLFRFFSFLSGTGIAHSPSPCEQVASPVELSSSRKKVSVNANPIQVPRSRKFLRFYNFIGFSSWFLRKWGPVCENWGQGSALMAGYVFWAQVAQIYFLGPVPQGQDIFWDFIILWD